MKGQRWPKNKNKNEKEQRIRNVATFVIKEHAVKNSRGDKKKKNRKRGEGRNKERKTPTK